MIYFVDINRTNDIEIEADSYAVDQAGNLNLSIESESDNSQRTVATFSSMSWVLIAEKSDEE